MGDRAGRVTLNRVFGGQARATRTFVIEEGWGVDGGERYREDGLENGEAEEIAAFEEGALIEVPAWKTPRWNSCSSAVFYPRVLCPFRGGTSLLWETSSRRGTVYATSTVFGGPPSPTTLPSWTSRRLRDDEPVEQVGMKVTFAVRTGDNGPVAVFEPAGNATCVSGDGSRSSGQPDLGEVGAFASGVVSLRTGSFR